MLPTRIFDAAKLAAGAAWGYCFGLSFARGALFCGIVRICRSFVPREFRRTGVLEDVVLLVPPEDVVLDELKVEGVFAALGDGVLEIARLLPPPVLGLYREVLFFVTWMGVGSGWRFCADVVVAVVLLLLPLVTGEPAVISLKAVGDVLLSVLVLGPLVAPDLGAAALVVGPLDVPGKELYCITFPREVLLKGGLEEVEEDVPAFLADVPLPLQPAPANKNKCVEAGRATSTWLRLLRSLSGGGGFPAQLVTLRLSSTTRLTNKMEVFIVSFPDG